MNITRHLKTIVPALILTFGIGLTASAKDKDWHVGPRPGPTPDSRHGWRDRREDRRDLRHDRWDRREDWRDLREDRRDGAPRWERRQDRRDLRRDNRDIRGDRRELRHDRHDRHEG